MHLPFSLFLFFCLAYGATASADMEQIQNVAMDVFQMLMNQIGHDNKTSMEVIQTLMNQLGHDNKTSIEDIEKSFMGNILDMGTELETEGTDTINKKINMSTANKTNTKIKATDLKSISKAVDADTVSAKNKDHYKNTTSITVDNGDSKTDATVVKNETAKGNMSDWRLIDYVEHPKETIVTALKASKEKINKLTHSQPSESGTTLFIVVGVAVGLLLIGICAVMVMHAFKARRTRRTRERNAENSVRLLSHAKDDVFGDEIPVN